MGIFNFIVMIFCAMCAIWKGVNGDIGWCIIEIGCTLLNLPFAIKWLKDFLAN